ncbi:aldose 1-epimerase [Conexibacter sp. JD483]|uniref:aldose 1-epimerase n=1 Tax=unclassified Conexibacter TaxID=2627773 RepID=UPI002716FCDE|nr:MULTISPECIES: aldose 1-epimerase [unclassified Conexibacter]MDO8185281.1 aldose 1-epimerase [Conexibacter sp. CPCC 205706]MDO8198327.1 aldose 1-epimerase [Conexibacter sp. CPCC 205762]MDR9367712.1 aldose 1-epimerase [Conexibacter sp. JD483]
MIETTEIDGYAAVRLDGGDGLTAVFAPGAGMVGVSLRDGDDELLGQRHGLASYAREARTMGIPLLHPWANRLDRDEIAVAGNTIALRDGAAGLHRDPNGLAIHGLLAGRPEWSVSEQEGAAFSATFDFGAHPELLASFPFPHELRLDIALEGRILRITSTVTPTGDCPVPLAYGFHPYLTLPGIPREHWVVELPACSHLALDERSIPTGAAQSQPATVTPLGDRAFDDAYVGVADGAVFAVSDPDDGRRIEVTFEQGFAAAQVYAPLSEPVICFEPMTAPTNALVSGESLRLAGPGAPAVAAFSIGVPRN